MKILVLNMHKCGKVVALSLLSFSLIFLFGGLFGLFLLLFIYFGGLLWPILFPHMGQCSINDDHHTYNSKLRAMMIEHSQTICFCRDNFLLALLF